MKAREDTPRDSFTPALEAIGNLLRDELSKVFYSGQRVAMSAHHEIEFRPIAQKRVPFYQHFFPFRTALVSVLANSYRQLFKLALAHPRHVGRDPHQWVWGQLESVLGAALEQIRDWYVLACDGENRYMQRIASIDFVPGQAVSVPIPLSVSVPPPPKCWCAPSWLFIVAPDMGFGGLKPENIPANDSEEKLGIAHTRLLLQGARRAFFWQLEAVIERVRNEEMAAAGAIPTESAAGRTEGSPKAPKHWLKGFEGLGPKKGDLSRYMHKMTKKQQLAFSLKYEYGLGPAEIASRMGIDRKTVREHLDAANRKVEEDRSFEKRRINRSKTSHDE